MTENNAPEVETEEVIDKSEFAQLDGVLSIRKALADDLAKIAAERKSVTGGKDAAIQALLNESDDPVLVKWRKDRDELAEKQKKAQEQQDAWLAAAKKQAESLLPEVDESKVDALREAYLTTKKKVTSMDVTLETLLGSPEQVARAKKAYGIVDVTSSVRGNRTTSTGEEIIRKRLASATIDGEQVADKKGKVTFTTLAADKRLAGISGDDLRNAAAKAHGVESVKDIPSETTVTFNVTVGNETREVSITTA